MGRDPASSCGWTPEPTSCARSPPRAQGPGAGGGGRGRAPRGHADRSHHLRTIQGVTFPSPGWGRSCSQPFSRRLREPRLHCTPGDYRFSREQGGGEVSPWASPWAPHSLPRNGGRPGRFAQVATPPLAPRLPRSQHPAGSSRRIKMPELPRSRPEGPAPTCRARPPPPPGAPESPPLSVGSWRETWRVPRRRTEASVPAPTLCVIWGAGRTTPRAGAWCVKPARVPGPRRNLGAPPRASRTPSGGGVGPSPFSPEPWTEGFGDGVGAGVKGTDAQGSAR